MTAKELRQAAEWFQSDDARGYSASVILKRDACGDVMSNYILATVQEDGEEKVDEAWLREEWGWNGVARDKTTTDIGCGFIYGKLVPHEHGCDYYVANMVISQPTTRSQFRSLMAGLGVSRLVRPLDEEL